MAFKFTIPANVQPEIRDAFQQVEEELKKRDIPIFKDMRDVRGIPEGTSCYYNTARSERVRKFTKINNRLYYEDLQKL
jgi:hypothetical protein